jgi:hypothetical protein
MLLDTFGASVAFGGRGQSGFLPLLETGRVLLQVLSVPFWGIPGNFWIQAREAGGGLLMVLSVRGKRIPGKFKAPTEPPYTLLLLYKL